MNRKPLQKLTQTPNYNQELFGLARGVVQNCQQLLNKSQALPPDQRPSIKDKQHQLETAIKNAINSFGKFVNISKAPLATLPDHALNIFESITDNIQTSVQRYREAQKNNKAKEEKSKEAKQTKQTQRPQDLYPFIKPAAFDFHNHQKNLEFIRTELSVTKSRSLDEEIFYVSTIPQLEEMVDQLIKESQVAVDVEHSNKSYEGMTCLIQISSRKKDYIVDVFPIWKEIPLLKKIMENQSIIKVMHGAEMDTKWLQRDFNIHIINLFDTHRASRVLGFPKLSYAYLLNYYCNQTTNKAFQLADWRQRPLTYEMLHYARLDTHYLLQIFDRLLSDLHQKALTMNLNPVEVITNVYASSYEVTKNQVELFDFRQKQFYIKLKKETKEKEFAIYEKIFGILDRIAKTEDISFDELVNHKLERHVISRIKQMLYIKTKDNIKIKVDKFLCIFKESHHHNVFQPHLAEIKQELESFLQSYEQTEEKVNKKNKKNRVVHLQQFQPTIAEDLKPQKTIFRKEFNQFPQRTYQNPNINPFSMLLFEPIMGFLSKKAGLSKKEDEGEQIEVEVMEEESAEQQMEAEDQQNQEKGEEGVIQFKRINPNVIYTIEQAEVVEEKHKPRKKRKEHEYEIKVKSKQANIFELLDD